MSQVALFLKSAAAKTRWMAAWPWLTVSCPSLAVSWKSHNSAATAPSSRSLVVTARMFSRSTVGPYGLT